LYCDGTLEKDYNLLCVQFFPLQFSERLWIIAPVVVPFSFLHLFLACFVLELGLHQRRLEVGTVVCAIGGGPCSLSIYRQPWQVGYLRSGRKLWTTTFVDAAYSLEASSLYLFPIPPTLLLIAGESISHGGLAALAPWALLITFKKALLGNCSSVD